MNRSADGKYVSLDIARALAALAVMVGHARAFVFIDYGAAGSLSPPWRAFYLVTSFGHQAVMIFFVMSGFLVGKHVFDAVHTGRWLWRDYAVKRLSRLWIVLIPALLLTAFWDRLGLSLTNTGFYTGELNQTLNIAPTAHDAATSYGASAFLGNLLFLQKILTPTFGTNAPLWSLSCEFWYYVLFPLIVLGLHPARALGKRVAHLALALAMALLLPRIILVYGLLWLAGFGVAMLRSRTRIELRGPPLAFALTGALALFAALLVFARLRQDLAGDFACGAGFAVLLYVLTWVRIGWRPAAVLARGGADFSYTLYLTHFPLLAFISALAFGNARMAPGASSAAVYGAMVVGAAAYAWLVYWLFERRTAQVQARLLRKPAPAPI